MKANKRRNARRIVQAVFLIIFLFLFIQTESKGTDELGYPVRLFLEFDPLLFLSVLLSGRAFVPAFLLALVTVAVTALLGRVFCGWICPLGTLNNMVSSLKRSTGKQRGWFSLKYYLLAFVLAASVFTLQPAGYLDPISLLVRSLSLGIYPAVNFIQGPLADASVSGVPVLAAFADHAYNFLKSTVFSFQQPYFSQSFAVSLIFIFILALNLAETRFWCRYLCPLGALLGVLSRFSILSRSLSEQCPDCGRCHAFCQGGGLQAGKDQECLQCFNCDDLCPAAPDTSVHRLAGRGRVSVTDLEKRRLFASVAAGLIAVPLVRVGANSRPDNVEAALIRPPGSLEEGRFLARCIRCGECMKVCITNGLQPALFEGGIEGLWTPILVPRTGYCEYNCTLCGQVCPTGAIARLSPEDKRPVKIGLASIDRSRCLPYANAIPCIVCEEVCPIPQKAIWFENAKVADRSGRLVQVKQPHVDLELCNGCGICEKKCPVLGRPAITVSSLGESRSKKNQLLLDK
jgi:MauM/NapG family ferredoxin protein